MTEVINLRDKPEQPYVRIDRRSKWGNPHKIGDGITRERAIELHKRTLKQAIYDQTVKLTDIRDLAGKRLACWCAPLPCHGDYLAALADMLEPYHLLPEDYNPNTDLHMVSFGLPHPTHKGVSNAEYIAMVEARTGIDFMPNYIRRGRETPQEHA